MTEEEGKLLDDILDKFYESKVAKGMGHITGVERWALERMASFIIEEGWNPPTERPISETAQIAELIILIQKVWGEYSDLQDQYRKLTGRQHEWLK